MTNNTTSSVYEASPSNVRIAAIQHRGASDAFNQLEDFVASVEKGGSTKNDAFSLINKLSDLSFGDLCDRKSISAEDLRKVGISEEELRENDPTFTARNHRLGMRKISITDESIQNGLFVLKTIMLPEDKFTEVLDEMISADESTEISLPLLCEILCDPELRGRAKKFINGK